MYSCDLGYLNKDGTINQTVGNCVGKAYAQRVAAIAKQVLFDCDQTKCNFALIYSINTSITVKVWSLCHHR